MAGVSRRALVKIRRRVSDDQARRIFQHLNAEGSLPIILDVLRDHRDTLVARIERAYIHHLAVTEEQKAALWARHGAASEVDRVIATFEALGAAVGQGTGTARNS
jgi:hypothetical protein